MNKPDECGKPRDELTSGGTYVLRLFVGGKGANGKCARQNLARLCETHLTGRCDVQIVDVAEDADAAIKDGVLVTPTLLLTSPPPQVRIIGDLSDTEKVLAALRLIGAQPSAQCEAG